MASHCSFNLHLGALPRIPSPSCVLYTRDLLQLGGELAQTSRAIQEASLGLSAGLRLAESRVEASLEKQALLQAQLEEQLRDKVLQEKDLAQLQVQSNLDKADLNARWAPRGTTRGRPPHRVYTRRFREEGVSVQQGWALPLCEFSQSPQAPRLAEGEMEVHRALAQGTSQTVQPLLLRPRLVPRCFPMR